MIKIVSLILAVSFPSAQAITLDQYLSMMVNKNKTFQSVEANLKAAQTRYDQGDLELSPFLNAKAFYQDDKSNQYGVGSLTSHQQIRQYSLGLAKKFSTGTQAEISGNVQAINAQGVASQTPFSAENHIGTMSFSMSQSLWKDFFGQSTRLRWQRENFQRQLEINSIELSKRNLLAEGEAVYWDTLYLQHELQVRQSSLERAKKIESWVRNRVSNGIGDKADLLNAQGLVAARELQLISTKDELKAIQEKVRLQLGLGVDEVIPSFEGNIKTNRSLTDLLDGQGSKVLRIDTYLSSLEADTKEVVASESAERVKPDLSLQAIYKTNSYESTDAKAIGKITNTEKPVFGVGLNFSWALDWDAKNTVRSTARSEALSARLKKEQKYLEGESAWREILRRHQELSNRVKAAGQLADIQTAKAAAEREKLSKGRTVTSNVITAEQDADEALLSLAKLNAEQRKLESNVRLFMKIQD